MNKNPPAFFTPVAWCELCGNRLYKIVHQNGKPCGRAFHLRKCSAEIRKGPIVDRPIIFTGNNPRLIIDGLKTQTRRIVKHRFAEFAKRVHGPGKDGRFDFVFNDETGGLTACPYGQKGDHLWGRETWRIDGLDQAGALARGYADHEGLSYRADMIGDRSCDESRWISPLFMPRRLSRITLEITAVRVERLNDISEPDALAEGVGAPIGGCWFNYLNSTPLPTGRESYRTLWDSIHGLGSWALNPWVWVLSFRNIDQSTIGSAFGQIKGQQGGSLDRHPSTR